ncbi:MAG: DUF3990 domain-containing protein [Candidatus Weimeria sp.]
MIIYHGSTMVIEKPDIKHSKKNLDFGVGFYTTTFPEQAERWAARKGMRLTKSAIVNVYELGELTGFHVKEFTDTDREWLQYVVDCRNGKDIYKKYDVVIGNVANDDVYKCVNMYMDRLWDAEKTLSEIRFFKKNDQIAFLTQEVIDAAVRFKEAYEVKV